MIKLRPPVLRLHEDVGFLVRCGELRDVALLAQRVAPEVAGEGRVGGIEGIGLAVAVAPHDADESLPEPPLQLAVLADVF